MAAGEGWSVHDVVCTAGRDDRPFQEQRAGVAVAMVVAGSFQYRSSVGHALMTPGSLLLGNPDQPFECAHDHGDGDRCVSFSFSRETFERLAADAGFRPGGPTFRVPRLPAMRALSPLVARACAGVAGVADAGAWEELAMEVAARALEHASQRTPRRGTVPPAAEARVTRVVRLIDRGWDDEPLTLPRLAREARLSSYHFLRTFQQVTGVTPHQYVRRVRLRQAAARLMTDRSAVIDVVFDCGFGDVSNFNRAFRGEFGMSPRQLRRRFAS